MDTRIDRVVERLRMAKADLKVTHYAPLDEPEARSTDCWQSVCGEWVTRSDRTVTPSCPECRSWLAEQAAIEATFAREVLIEAMDRAVSEAMADTLDLLILRVEHDTRERGRIATILREFFHAPISASALQPILDLAVQMNPDLKVGATVDPRD